MKYVSGAPTSLIPAQPGTRMEYDTSKGDTSDYDVIAWAVVVIGYDAEGHAQTAVQPVVLFFGTPLTESQWRFDTGYSKAVEVIQP